MFSLNIGVLNLLASELLDGVEVSGMVKSFIIHDEVVVEDEVPGLNKFLEVIRGYDGELGVATELVVFGIHLQR